MDAPADVGVPANVANGAAAAPADGDVRSPTMLWALPSGRLGCRRGEEG